QQFLERVKEFEAERAKAGDKSGKATGSTRRGSGAHTADVTVTLHGIVPKLSISSTVPVLLDGSVATSGDVTVSSTLDLNGQFMSVGCFFGCGEGDFASDFSVTGAGLL